jgi:hypothetical protein
MKSVLISIQPKWCELIASGEKTIEVRKTKPKLETPFKVCIYETQGRTETPWIDEDGHTIFKGRGQVIGEFVCDKVYDLKLLPKEYYGKPAGTYEQFICENSCLSFDDIKAYGKGTSIYGWHISDLKIYDKPRELGEFRSYNVRFYIDEDFGLPLPTHKISRPPQSWCYVESEDTE